MTLRARLKEDLLQATRARDRATMATLRDLLGALDNAEAVAISAPAWPPIEFGSAEVPRRLLSQKELRLLLQREADEHRRAAETYTQLGQVAAAEEMRAKAELVAGYLQGMDDEAERVRIVARPAARGCQAARRAARMAGAGG